KRKYLRAKMRKCQRLTQQYTIETRHQMKRRWKRLERKRQRPRKKRRNPKKKRRNPRLRRRAPKKRKTRGRHRKQNLFPLRFDALSKKKKSSRRKSPALAKGVA